jgi:hypothetical protein
LRASKIFLDYNFWASFGGAIEDFVPDRGVTAGSRQLRTLTSPTAVGTHP